jgi:hypothetical protein
MIWTILAIGAVVLLAPIVLPVLIPLALLFVLVSGGARLIRGVGNSRWCRSSTDAQAEVIARRYAHLGAQLDGPRSFADRAEREAKQKAKEGGVLAHTDGKPFRIYETSAIRTTAKWLQQRRLYAEVYDDGHLKGYAVYEGRHDGIKVVGIHEFNRRYRRWVD